MRPLTLYHLHKSVVHMSVFIHFREFVCANERHPQSVRTVPWLRAGSGDSRSGDAWDASDLIFFTIAVFGKIDFQPPQKLSNFKISI